MLEPCADPFKAVYYGKAPPKTSGTVYIEQAPRTRDIHHQQWYPDVHGRLPSRTHVKTHAGLLDQFPNPSPHPLRHTRGVLRTTSLNSMSIRTQLPPQRCNTSSQHVAGRQRTIQQYSSATRFSEPTATSYPSVARKLRREATADQAVADLLKTADGQPPIFGSTRQAERGRAKSNVGHSYTPIPPGPPVRRNRTTHSPRPLISHSAYNTRTNMSRSRDWI
jgi:hypothetical protein